MAKRKRKSAAVYDYDAAFKYGLISDRVGAEIDRRAARLQHQLEQLDREQEELENQQLADSYRARRLAEEQSAKTIAPQFVDYVTGASAEEVEHSIELAKAKTSEIAAQIRQIRPRGSDGRFIADEQQIIQDVQNMSFKEYVQQRDHLIHVDRGLWT